jgi:hypothetical protein
MARSGWVSMIPSLHAPTPPGTPGVSASAGRSGSCSHSGHRCRRTPRAPSHRSRRKAGAKGRWHGNRHTLVTELAESGAGDEVIMSIAGHVSRAMLSRYSHVRMEAKRRALDEIAARQRAADEKRKADVERLAAAALQSRSLTGSSSIKSRQALELKPATGWERP